MKTAHKTILLADDNQDYLELFGETLESVGYRIITKTDGHSALAALAEERGVDLVITDYKMQGMDGLEFVAELKKMALPVPVIMLTGHGAIQTYIKAISLGVFEFVNKPTSMKELQVIIKAALKKAERGSSNMPANTRTREMGLVPWGNKEYRQ